MEAAARQQSRADVMFVCRTIESRRKLWEGVSAQEGTAVLLTERAVADVTGVAAARCATARGAGSH
jgi:hypothetical protein